MTTQNNGDELERQKFERWYLSRPGAKEPDIRRLNNGTYYFPSVQWRWEAWKASRDAIELNINWPEANDDYWKDGEEGAYARGHEDGKDKTALAVRQALKSAGIKVNP